MLNYNVNSIPDFVGNILEVSELDESLTEEPQVLLRANEKGSNRFGSFSLVGTGRRFDDRMKARAREKSMTWLTQMMGSEFFHLPPLLPHSSPISLLVSCISTERSCRIDSHLFPLHLVKGLTIPYLRGWWIVCGASLYSLKVREGVCPPIFGCWAARKGIKALV